MKESRFVKAKIFAGYTILVVVCILTVGYVYREVVRFTAPDGSFALLQAKRQAVNRTLYHLYQAEGYGQLMIAGYGSYEKRYKDELHTVHVDLDSLRTFLRADDSVQTMRLDSISGLISDKQRRTMNLRQSIRLGGTATLLDKNIEALLDEPAAVDFVPDARPVEVRQDTVRISKSKRRFFRRIADIFSPPKIEQDIVVSREVIHPDSVVGGVGRDTITHVLRALQDRVTNDRLEIYAKAWDEGARLRFSNDLINEKIYNLLVDFEAESTDYLLHRVERTDAIRERSSRMLGLISVSAVMLVLLFVVVLWRDVNRSNRYRRELEQANREKEALLAAREKLMLAITHDIKAPLGSIMGYIDLFSRLTLEKRQSLYLHNMKDSAGHLLALVESLLDFYRLDANKIDINEVSFCPAQLFETIRAGFAPAAERKGLDLRLEVDASAECEVSGDVFRIRQVADNLLSNAVKFTDEGSVTLRAEVSDGRLVFAVRDTGRGIGAEEEKLIFTEFMRLGSAQGVEGFGLGLSIVDRLVKLLGGRIWFESRKGEGTRFTVSIPVKESRGDAKPSGVGKIPVGVAGNIRVLLIDDDPLQLEMASAMCREAGITAEACQYPEYAAKLVAEQSFDLVFTDIQMPGMDGFRVREAIRAVKPELSIVAVTARSDNAAGEFKARGFAAVLRKPFTAAELMGAIVKTGSAVHSAAVESAATGLDALTAYAGDDKQAACRILESFVEQTTDNCRLLSQAMADGDWATLRATAHKMLPIFTMLGERQIAATLRRIETYDESQPEAIRPEALGMLENIASIVEQAQKKVSLLSV